jgi:predicted transcriptional regulator
MARMLMTLHSDWANEIYTGRKRFEYRRVRMNVRSGDQVVICESGRLRPVTGHFRVATVKYGTPDQLAKLETDSRRRKSVTAYLQGARTGTALEISGARRYRRPRTLASLGLTRVPMSYRKL